MRKFLFTSESVGSGHPDKLCDIVSDAILDAFISLDCNSRVAVETAVKDHSMYVLGEVSSKAIVDIERVARTAISRAGYVKEDYDPEKVRVVVNVSKQSQDIADAVIKDIKNTEEIINKKVKTTNDTNLICERENIENEIKVEKKTKEVKRIDFYKLLSQNGNNFILKTEVKDLLAKEDKDARNEQNRRIKLLNSYAHTETESINTIGAGDQGMVFGYATNETEEMMPLTLLLSHNIVRNISKYRNKYPFLKTDCKSQVTIEYLDNRGTLIPLRVHTVVVSAMHSEESSVEKVRDALMDIVKITIPSILLIDTKFYIQPSGKFIVGGPTADAGLTGRKTQVDSYGSFGSSGGGAFSGKDPSKVDRSGAYYARYLAKSLIASKLCRRCSVQLTFAIGMTKPLAVFVDSFGTADDDAALEMVVKKFFNLDVASMIGDLKLTKQRLVETACYGHFGRREFSWERKRDLMLEIGEKK